MVPGGYLFRQLLLLVGVSSLPLLALLAYNVNGTAQNSRREALEAIDNQAIAVAHDVEGLLVSARQYLAYLAEQPMVRALDGEHCDPVLAGVTQRRAHFANVLVLDAAGRPVCSSIKGPGAIPPTMADMPWFAPALNGSDLHLSQPYLAPIAQKQVVALARSLHDTNGLAIGVVAVLFDLDSLQRTWLRYKLPEGARLSVVADDGTLIVTSPDFERWVGKNVQGTIANAMRANPGGHGLAIGIDGVERAFSRVPLEGWGVSAFAAYPARSVFKSYRAELERSFVVTVLALAAAAALAVLMARRLSVPLHHLARVANQVREGDLSVRAGGRASGEFEAVAQAVDAMLDSLRQSKEALQASRRHYAEFFANVEMLSFMAGLDGRITHANHHLLSVTGRSNDELIGANVSALFAPQAAGEIEAWRQTMLAGQAPSASEMQLYTRDERSLTVHWHHSLLRDDNDCVVGLASLGEDVTQARALAIRERRQLDLYAALSRTNSAMVRLVDPQELLREICRICVEHGHASIAYITVLVSDTVARPAAWAGPALDFLSGQDLNLVSPMPESRGVTATAINTGRRFVVDDSDNHPATQFWRDRGRKVGTRSLASFPFRRAGRVAGALTLHMTTKGFFDDERVIDLLEEIVADLSFALDHLDQVEHLRVMQRSVVEREQQLAGMVETAMDAVITVDVRQQVRLFNRAASDMFGVPADEAIGGSLERFIPERFRGDHHQHVARFGQTGSSARRMGALSTLLAVRSNGEEFPIEASISKWGQGEQALMTVVIRDVTELRLADEARLARAEAESANRAKSEFLSRMSHELRTPLNAIIGFSQLLRGPGASALSRTQAEQVDYILHAGWHLLALVSDVLDVSRIEAGRMQVDPRGLDGVQALSEAVRLTQGSARKQGLIVSPPVDCTNGQPGVLADPIRLRQVLLNILSNAVKYSPDGGRVSSQLERRGELVCFSIVDSGMGMTPQQLAHLFEPFNRLGRESGPVEGTGLGLALTRQLVALMDGTLEVRSELGRGSTVEVLLPACEVQPPAASSKGAMPAAAADEPAGTVLYIEDNPVNRLLVEQLLARWPEVVLVQASDGQTGIDMARSVQPQLVLLDMRLPDMDGRQVLAALRADPSTRDTYVIGLSGDAMPEDRESALSAGANDYWTKPFKFEDFLAELAHRLSRVEATAAAGP